MRERLITYLHLSLVDIKHLEQRLELIYDKNTITSIDGKTQQSIKTARNLIMEYIDKINDIMLW